MFSVSQQPALMSFIKVLRKAKKATTARRHPGTAAEVNLGDQRIIDVFDEYDAMELGSARAYLDWELKNAGNKNVLEIRETVLQGLRGVQARYELKQRGSAQVVESVIVLRGGVVYHLL